MVHQRLVAMGFAGSERTTRRAVDHVDRLLHHAHVVLTEGSSHRLAEATAGKGVAPLT